jgi:hypothetical protein
VQKISVRHTFPCTPDQFWDMFWDDGYDKMVLEAADVQRETLSEQQDGDVLVQVVRTTPNRELPAAVGSVLGASKLIYTQTTRFDRGKSQLTWDVQPNVMADKVTAQGVFTVRPTATGCERVVEGQIEVRVRFIGGRIESAIVDDVTRSYGKAAEVAQKWLAARKLA